MAFNASYKSAMFFIGITMISLAKSEPEGTYYEIDDPYSPNSVLHIPDNNASEFDSNKSKLSILFPSQDLVNIPQESSYYLSSDLKSPASQSDTAECPALRQGTVVRGLLNILTPQISSQVDPLRYLINKTMKIPRTNMPSLSVELNKLLRFGRLPECYVPFARALSSLLLCWSNFDSAASYIRDIQKISPKNTDFSFIPADVSSTLPELLDLFSGDIIDDPEPPIRLFYKLLDMPKRNIVDLKAQSKKFVDWMLRTYVFPRRDRQCYIWFAVSVANISENESHLDRLKNDVAPIRRMTISDQSILPATSMDSPETQV